MDRKKCHCKMTFHEMPLNVSNVMDYSESRTLLTPADLF